MKNSLKVMRRPLLFVVASLLAVSGVLPALFGGTASAAQFTNRYIKLSDSSVSGGSIVSGPGSGDDVIYNVGVTVSNVATNIGGIAIDFCSNSPLPGDSCTAPTGFDANSATLSVNNQTNISGLSVYTTGALANRVILTKTAGAPTGAAISFELGNGTTNGVTNPTSKSPLYARIYTYTTSAAAQGHNTGTPSGYTDYGGIALSINDYVSITARVQESMTFCTSAADLSGVSSNNCTFATTPSLTIGHGGPPAILDSTAVDQASAYTQLSTNATSGAIVRMRATNACSNAGLSKDGGATCLIPGINSGSTPAAMTAGTAGFGLFVANSTTTTGVSSSTGTVTPDTSYHNALHTTIPGDLYFGMDSSTVGDNVTTTYGDTIMASSAPVSQINNRLVFAATASLTTSAGIYTGNEVLIATGTF